MRREKVRHLRVNEPWEIECRYTFGGFELSFRGQGPKHDARKATISLHFCDVEHLAEKLWGVVKERRKKVERMEKAMRGETQ